MVLTLIFAQTVVTYVVGIERFVKLCFREKFSSTDSVTDDRKISAMKVKMLLIQRETKSSN